MARPNERRVRLPKESKSDRRASVRFPIALDVRYTVSRHRALVKTGKLVDLSSSGLRFVARGPLEPGVKLDVAIDWPILLDGRVQLQLIVTGTVVWSSDTETAMRIDRHVFRTRGMGLSAALPQESEGRSVASVKAVKADPVGSLLMGRPARTG